MRAMLRHPVRFVRDHRFTRSHASDFLDGELDDDGRHRVEEHAGMCPPCRQLLDSLKRTISELRGLREPPAGDVASGVIARLRDEA